MAKKHPPLGLSRPRIAIRRPDRPRPVPVSSEIISKRKVIAQSLIEKIRPISESLQQMSEDQRKVVFFKIEHKGKINLVGTGLKAISPTSAVVTLAIPTQSTLSGLEAKIKAFGDSTPTKTGVLPHSGLAIGFKSIKKASARDRLCQQFRSKFSELTKRKLFVYEIELLTLKTGKQQQKEELAKIRTEVKAVLKSNEGETIFEHEDSKGSCRMVMRTSGATFKALVEDQEWHPKVVFFDTRPKFQTFSETIRDFVASECGASTSPDVDAPIVCIIDSGIGSGNPLLKPVSRENLFKSFLKRSPLNPFDENGHGSGVASLAAYYALDISKGATNLGKVWVVSARILDKDNFSEENAESDEGRLLSKVIREVVETFAPQGIRIFNLSVNDLNLTWNDDTKKEVPRNSWVAREIDYLSRKYDVLFVISAGNLTRDNVREMVESEPGYPKYLVDPQSRLLDPAQSALALTVGSTIHSNKLVGSHSAGHIAIGDVGHPSAFTRTGPGICGEIKPELVELGGTYVRTLPNGVTSNPGTNVLMATNSDTPVVTHMAGTSFAAPRVANCAAMTLQELKKMGIVPSATLLKSLIVNSANYSGTDLKNFLAALDPSSRETWLNILGYGRPDSIRTTEADPYSALLYYQGTIKPNRVAFLSIPVPKELAFSERGTKRLTVTVSFAPEVQRWGLENYLGTIFKWRVFRGDIDQDSVIAAMSVDDEEDGDYRHSLEQEIVFTPGITVRSRGTTQHGIFEWNLHEESYSANSYTLAIATYERWGRKNGADVPYSVVVRLEDLTSTCEVNSLVRSIIEIPAEIPLSSAQTSET